MNPSPPILSSGPSTDRAPRRCPAPWPPLPAWQAPWQAWRDHGLAWAEVCAAAAWSRDAPRLHPADGAASVATAHAAARRMTFHAYREPVPGRRWKGLFDVTWPAYRRFWLRDGVDARPSLAECRDALERHMPQLVPTWRRLAALTADADPLAARLLAQWRLPPFVGGCSQAIVPAPRPALVRNYDYHPDLFEGVIASTNLTGRRRVLGTSDLLWGLLDGINDAGLAVSLSYGGRPDVGVGFCIPLVLRWLLETCDDVDAAVRALCGVPVAQAYNVALVDSQGNHATVFVAPDRPATVGRLRATTNHRLGVVEHAQHAARFRSVERQQRLLALADEGADAPALVRAMLAPPLRSADFDAGFGTLYTVALRPSEATATWHWPDGQSWRRGFDDPDGEREVTLAPNRPADEASDGRSRVRRHHRLDLAGT